MRLSRDCVGRRSWDFVCCVWAWRVARDTKQKLDIVLDMPYSLTMTKTQQPTKVEWAGVIQNTCTCTKYDPITQESTDELTDDCNGDCWDDALHLFHCDIKEWWDANPNYDWQVDGLPLWNRSVSGEFTAKTIPDLIRGITVNGEWRLSYRVSGETLYCNLSHHDVPMGRSYTVTYNSTDGE